MLRLVGILLFIIILSNIDLGKSLRLLRDTDLSVFFLAALLLIPLYLLRVLRWNFLLRSQGVDYPIISTLLVVLSSNFIGFTTPGRVGELAKVFYLRNDLGIPYSSVLPTVLLDRLFDVYTLLAFGVFGFIRYSLLDKLGYVSVLLLLIVMIFPLFVLWDKISHRIFSTVLRMSFLKKHRSRVLAFLDDFYDGIRLLLNVKLTVGFLLTVGAYLVLFYLCDLLAASAGIELDLLTVVFFVSVANILSYMPISISGIGTRDASFIFLFAQIGKSMEEAVVFSTLILICFYIMGGLAGFICFTIKPVQISKIRDKEKSPVDWNH